VTAPALGVTLPHFTDDPERFLDAARRAEALGLDSIWVFDHLWPLSGGKHRPAIEAWTGLAWLAEATRRVCIGTLVTRSSLRHPALLGRMAATVATIAPGRVIVGVGSGDFRSRAENEAFGAPYFSGDARVAQLAGTVVALRRMLRDPVVTERHPFLALTEMPSLPLPIPAPDVWVAGVAPPVLDVAGRLADGWNGWGGSPERFAANARALARAAGDRRVTPTWGGLVILGASDEEARAKLGARDPRSYVVGGPATVARHLREMVAAGARHLVATFPDAWRAGVYELFAREVRPRITDG
jgi:alkanesulfonate monooxygenase SsuD/methylene tetrahydromethanopterin reductase-like flavin-dependent oxidoreductase (luciferase family)